MYKRKSEIIETIQSYHQQVSDLYIEIKNKIDDDKIKSLIDKIRDIETNRVKYLEKRRKVAIAMNCYLEFPDEKLNKKITKCFDKINLESDFTPEKLLEIEMHFNDCLIKLYTILSLEVELNVPIGCEKVSNIFYYMIKDTEKKKCIFCEMLKK
jgi:hypothetical protein